MDNQKKICVIHRYPVSLVRGTNPSFPLFLSKLVWSEYKVYFISFREDNPSFLVPVVTTLEINSDFKRDKPLSKLLKSFLFVLWVPWKVLILHIKNHLDLVYCDDSFPFYGYLIKKIVRVKTIIRLGDLQSGYAFASGGTLKRLLFKCVFGLEKMMWRSLDGLVVISESFNKFLVENKIPPDNIYSVEECIDFEMFKPGVKDKSLYDKYNLKDNPIVMFHGAIVRCKGIDTLIRAIPVILNKYPSVQFVIVGDGDTLGIAKRLVVKLNLKDSVIFTGWVPFDKIPDFVNICNIGIPLRSSNLANNFVVTTALLQYWAMEKPVVAPRMEAMSKVINSDGGLLFQPDNHLDLAEKVIYFLENPGKAKEAGIIGRKKAMQYFNIELISEKMKEVMQSFI